ncbi:forkhead box protein N4-like [Watersipora subatra]|uniref:forkhead box protein N4-like n=1 Tax=Watersipora subatra TaxID=2589382 RepID=UPI00355BA872
MQIKNLFYDDTMDCYRTAGADSYAADIPELMASNMELLQQEDHMKEPTSYQPLTSAHMLMDGYRSISQDNYTSSGSPDTFSNTSQENYAKSSQNYGTAAHQLQEYVQKFPVCSPIDSNISNLDWLQPIPPQPQHHPLTPESVGISIANNDQSVHNQSLTAKMLSLPNSVQISGGSINYVNMPSSTQQVYASSTKCSPASQPADCADSGYRARSDSSSSYVLSPNSTPSSTIAENPFPKPAYSYSCLIALALKNSQNGSLPVAEIYSFMMRHFPYFKTAPDGWKNSVRHNLSLNKCFEKIENPNADGTNSRKGCLWALNPAKAKKMDEEIYKWNKKDPLSIKRAMTHPEMLEMLSKGQEPFSPRNGIKRLASHGRPLPACNPLQHQTLHQPMHPHSSPSHSPKMRAVESTATPAIVSTCTASVLPPSITMAHHIPCPPGQQVMSNAERPHDMYGVNSGQHLTLDASLSDIPIQSGMFDDLPAELLDYQYTYSPTAFLLSPKKTSPPLSPTGQHTSELPAGVNNIPRGMLISLGQN